jgi:hypothetical protein
MSERPPDPSRPTDKSAEEPLEERPGDEPAPDEHRFAADEEVADDPAGAKEARTPGMGS